MRVTAGEGAHRKHVFKARMESLDLWNCRVRLKDIYLIRRERGLKAASALGHVAGTHLYPFLVRPRNHPGRTRVSVGLFGRSGNVRATAASLTP